MTCSPRRRRRSTSPAALRTTAAHDLVHSPLSIGMMEALEVAGPRIGPITQTFGDNMKGMNVGQVRPGGRSARIQAAIHSAAKELLTEVGRDVLTVPLIAERAGVAPTTIYRRWGDLSGLLADVASNKYREAPSTPETGTLVGDLRAYAVYLLEESASEPGRQSLVDMLGGTPLGETPSACIERGRANVGEILTRHGVTDIEVDVAVDRIVAPIIFRSLYDASGRSEAYAVGLVDSFLA